MAINQIAMSDDELIKAVLDGDRNRFRQLVDKYQLMVFRTCIGFLHEKVDAEDLTQEVFISAYQSLDKFKGESVFSTWIYRIAVNASLNFLRKKSRRLFYSTAGLPPESGRETAFPAADPEDPETILVQREHSKWIQDALDSLPENQRTAIILSKYDDLPQKEIASIMNTTEGAVEALIQRAKVKLREKLSSSYKKNRKVP